jgi:hypothetical protein
VRGDIVEINKAAETKLAAWRVRSHGTFTTIMFPSSIDGGNHLGMAIFLSENLVDEVGSLPWHLFTP